MRIIRYLKMAPGAVALVFLLLIIEVSADLALPNFTSDIVDVGIQQSGVEHAATDELTADTFDIACMMADESGEQLLRSAYIMSEDGDYHFQESTASDRADLDALLTVPLIAVHYGSQMGGFDAAQLLSAYEGGSLSKEQVSQAVQQAMGSLGDMSESLIQQQAIAAAQLELQAAGVDTGSVQMNYLLRMGLLMLGVTAVGAAASICTGFVASRTGAKIGRTLRGKLFERVVSFSDAEVQSFSAASLITRGTNDIQQIQMVTIMLLRMVLYAPIMAVGGIVMVSFTNVSMSWVIVLAVVCLFLVVGILMRLALPKFKIMQKLIDRVNLVAREMLTGLSVVRAFGRQGFEAQRFDQASTELMKTQLFTNRVMTFMMPAMMLIMNGVSVLIVWVGAGYIDNGTIQTGDMIAFINYSMLIIMSFLIIGMISIMLPRADVAAERVNEVLNTQSSIADPEQPRDTELPTGGLEVAFNDVTFGYNDGEGAFEPVLHDISFTVEPGTTCAIIGSTGSGKSTVAKLLERFYDVTEGSVTVGGIDVRDLTQHTLRSQVGYVPQKAFLFSGTIGTNICYGNEGATPEQMTKAASIAQAGEFIAEKPEGFDSPIAQGGTNVSGGQRQRLCIARALATDARVLLFDDSFSALDYKTDATLRQALAREAAGRTVIIVAQRIATVLDADQIIVLEEGRMVGKGTHAQLMETCEEYREIAQSQLSEEELRGGGAA